MLYTNMPLNVHEVAKEVYRRSGRRVSAESVESRIVVFTREEMAPLTRDHGERDSGGVDVYEWIREHCPRPGLIVFDECHHYCKKTFSRRHLDCWVKWLGEIRHDHQSLYLISQNHRNIARVVVELCGARWQALSVDEMRDPFMNIPLKAWYNLEAGLIWREYFGAVRAMLLMEEASKWEVVDQRFYRFNKRGFKLYNSHNARDVGQGVTSARDPEPWERRGRLSIIGWFVANYFSELSGIVFSIGLKVGLVLGIPLIMQWMISASREKISARADASGRRPSVKRMIESQAVAPAASSRSELASSPAGVVSGAFLGQTIRLDAVIGSRALMEGRWYAVGDDIRGVKVVDVSCVRGRGRVRLSNGDTLGVGVVAAAVVSGRVAAAVGTRSVARGEPSGGPDGESRRVGNGVGDRGRGDLPPERR